MRVKLNIRDNKLSQLSTDLAVVREELETVSDSSNKFRLENRQLEERAKFLTDENERLTNAYNELLELRQKLATAVKVFFQ
jgi:predicted nuclease with TOPRIM domain